MRKFSESTGHRDYEGNWIEESITAKLRNQLGPIWTLISILSEERLDKVLNSDGGLELITDLVKNCKDSQVNIIELIKKLENPS